MRSVGFALGDKKFLTVLDNIMGNTATIFVWDLELDNLANHPDCPLLTIQGHQAKINRALWGPLNEQIYSCSDDARRCACGTRRRGRRRCASTACTASGSRTCSSRGT